MPDPTYKDETLRQRFLGGMGLIACTVSIVTTDGTAGRYGTTVSAMASVSADGEWPTLLVCIHHQSNTASAILQNGAFCVNVLRGDHASISDNFAGRRPAPEGDKFACADWVLGSTGAPALVGGLVIFHCRLRSGERVGTHHVFIGEVREVETAPEGAPLIYASRAYGTPMPIAT